MKLSEIHAACQMIEADGVEAVEAVSRLFGRDAAMVLVVAHLRRAAGSMKSFPADEKVEAKVNQILAKLKIV